jgi:hypothetical protein
MPLFRALAKNMAASYFGKKAAPYGFVMEVTLLYVFILCQWLHSSPSRVNGYTFDNYVTHAFWCWSLALISKLRKVIGSRVMRARFPGQMT